MCKVKSGTDIKNRSDFQNLVMGIILRQNTKYNENDIFKAVMYHSKNSQILINPTFVKNVISENLHFLIRSKRVFCIDGIYIPLNIVDNIMHY